MTLEKAYQICKAITVHHYENFPVASRLLPRKIRQHVYPIYAFARHADDLADEEMDKEGLLHWRNLLHRSVRERVDHPIFLALSDTIRKFNLPVPLFDDLLTAFLQDLEKQRYRDIRDLLRYCRNSANPVGRIILLLHGYSDKRLFRYSDHLCTALQFTNFWQDVHIDIQKDRIYIPQSYLKKYRVSEDMIVKGQYSDNFKELMKALLQPTHKLFMDGLPLIGNVRRRLRWELKFTVLGGLKVLEKIGRLDYNVLEHRPTLKKSDWMKIGVQSFTKKLVTT